MPKYTIRGTKQVVELDNNNLKAKGGEGAVHLIGDTAYKVCDDGKMIPEAKIRELQVLAHQSIIKPDDILLNSRSKPVGYTMRAVPGDAVPLAEILTKTYREREGLPFDTMLELVKQIVTGLRFIHQHPGYLQVDGNELNYMVDWRRKSIHFIDTNSFQTPSFPATAIMASIRDYHCKKGSQGYYLWSTETDWYSFAIISFFMLTGIHPFKGVHPSFKNPKTRMVDQMMACKSVLDPETKFPESAVYFPFENFIPGGRDGAYMQWYRAIFIENKRLPAPIDFQAVAAAIVVVQKVIGSNNFDIQELRDYADPIIGYSSNTGKEVVITQQQVFTSGQPGIKPSQRFRVGFTPKRNTPIGAWLEDGLVKLVNLESKVPVFCDLGGKNIMSCEGRLYVQGEQHISEIAFVESEGILAVGRQVASVLPYATSMYQGVVMQDAFGVRIASVFPESKHHRSMVIDELKGTKITDAKYEGNVLMVVTLDQDTGQYNRHVFRFSKDWSGYDVFYVAENITPSGINFTVLDNGVCICLTEDEKVEIFSSQMGKPDLKSITDPAIKVGMRLCHYGSQVRFAHGQKMYSIAVRKS